MMPSCVTKRPVAAGVPCLWTTPVVNWPEQPCAWSSTIASSPPTACRDMRGTPWSPRRVAWCQNQNTSSWLVRTRSDITKTRCLWCETWSSSSDGADFEMDHLISAPICCEWKKETKLLTLTAFPVHYTVRNNKFLLILQHLDRFTLWLCQSRTYGPSFTPHKQTVASILTCLLMRD